MMRAAVLRGIGEPLSLSDVAIPRPREGQVLVRVAASGVCYTDLKVADGLATRMPLIPGHETVGVVAEVGPRVESILPGTRVAVHAGYACGHCAACVAGRGQFCALAIPEFAGFGRDGGYAEYTVAPAASLIPLPDAITFTDGAPLLCAGLTTFAGLRNAGLTAGQRVVVVGFGGLGHLAVSIGAALGAHVYAVTGSPDKIDDAVTRGAVFAGSATEVAERLVDDGGAHVVLNTVDYLGPTAALVPALAVGATVVLAGASGDAIPIQPMHFLTHQLTVVGTFYGSVADAADLLALAAGTGIRPQVERYELGDVNHVHDRLRANAVRYRAVLEI